MKFQDEYFYYATNAQGDVTAILNSSGNTVATYSYDAWGKPTTAIAYHVVAVINPLRYRSYVYDNETELYYLQSRYYNPEIGRFLNADAYAATGQGLLGNNMFAYCLNNPVSYYDSNGRNAEAIQWWTGGMWWLPYADNVVPIGDAIYLGGILVLGVIALCSEDETVPEITYTEVDVAYGPPSPNDGNNDDKEEYRDEKYDESSYGGRQRIGKSKGKAPRDNKAQNKQFKFLTRNLTKAQKRRVHDLISGKGLSAEEIAKIIDDLFSFVVGVFAIEYWEDHI